MSLDDPSRFNEISTIIENKASLKNYYLEIYRKYKNSLEQCPRDGIAIELGSGGGFVKKLIPEMVTTDLIPYPTLDNVVDATKMSFPDASLKFICMLNVLHHIPDAPAFFSEAVRCLKPGGRIFIVDQYPGWLSKPIYKHAHHEPFDENAKDWKFASSGPLSGANGALAWIIFERDRAAFESKYPELKIAGIKPHSPLRYWLTGGLKNWNLLPGWAFGFATFIDRFLVTLLPKTGSFMDIELVRVGPERKV